MKIVFGFFALSLLIGGMALAQTTGSRVGRGEQPVTVVEFDEPGELTAVRAALAAGKPQEAVDHAKSLLDRDVTQRTRYAALNALCASHTAAGERQAAFDACNRAVELHPNRWMALNTRGNLYLVTGAPEKAVRDFEQALTLLAEDSRKADLVRHNLALAQARAGAGS